MSIDPTEIQLNPVQQQAIARIAEQKNRTWESILEESLLAVLADLSGNPVEAQESALDVAERLGLVGCFEGPSDLSIHPKHGQGFGENGKIS